MLYLNFLIIASLNDFVALICSAKNEKWLAVGKRDYAIFVPKPLCMANSDFSSIHSLGLSYGDFLLLLVPYNSILVQLHFFKIGTLLKINSSLTDLASHGDIELFGSIFWKLYQNKYLPKKHKNTLTLLLFVLPTLFQTIEIAISFQYWG